MSNPIRIAVDAMGGDRAPQAIVEGALAAAESYGDVELHLVGQPEAMQPFLGGGARERVVIVPAADVIGMEEHPAKALRRKPDASIAVCGRLLREGTVSAIVSAGNTGSVVAASLFAARLLPGVHRPGIAVSFPCRGGGTSVLCDVGANINMKPVHYLQYAVMAAAYCKDVLGVARPRVGMLNIGTEESKGGTELRAVRELLSAAAAEGAIDFVGAVEGNHIFEGEADVVVCDGFAGNTILKAAEGAGRIVFEQLAAYVKEALAGAGGGDALPPGMSGAIEDAIKKLKAFTDYSTYGGAPLLGIDGCAIIAHGRSNARAVKHAIQVARDFARSGVNAHIAQALDQLGAKGVGAKGVASS
ncbi:MAG: phosphate acyltransferase PlsX [Planctomycetota bacterium]